MRHNHHPGDAIFRVAPPADLRPLVEAFAGRTAFVSHATFPIFPTARAELLFHFADPFLVADTPAGPMRPLAEATLLGPRMRNYWQSAGPRIDWFMVQLTAFGCERLLGVRFGEVWNREAPLAGAWGGDALSLYGRLRTARSFQVRLAIAIETLRSRFGHLTGADCISEAGVLARAGRVRTIEALCAHLDIGPRRLHQRFVVSYGVSPKLFLNLMRFGRQLENRHPLNGQGKSHDPEYYDDSHAIREFRRFTGLTPSAYVRQKSSGDRLLYTGAAIVD